MSAGSRLSLRGGADSWLTTAPDQRAHECAGKTAVLRSFAVGCFSKTFRLAFAQLMQWRSGLPVSRP